MTRVRSRPAGPLAAVALALLTCCERVTEPSPSVEPPVPAKPADILIFPDDLRVADPSVNEFVERAMKICAEGDYERFRLLWSARHEPLSREEFEQGWQAVQQIALRALERAVVEGGDSTVTDTAPQKQEVYLALAEVAFDPDHPAARGETQREVILMLIREQDQWRLARATRTMREWIRQSARREPADVVAEPEGG